MHAEMLTTRTATGEESPHRQSNVVAPVARPASHSVPTPTGTQTGDWGEPNLPLLLLPLLLRRHLLHALHLSQAS